MRNHRFVNVAVADGKSWGIGYCIDCGYDANLDLPEFPSSADISDLFTRMKPCNPTTHQPAGE